MEKNPVKTDARRAKRERRFGKDARCAHCGTGSLECLIPVKASLVEGHHAVGRANDPDLEIPLCRNCHALATERQMQADVSLTPPKTVLHKIVEVLKSLGAFFGQLTEKCFEWAQQLAQFIAALDARYPTWTQLPEAQS